MSRSFVPSDDRLSGPLADVVESTRRSTVPESSVERVAARAHALAASITTPSSTPSARIAPKGSQGRNRVRRTARLLIGALGLAGAAILLLLAWGPPWASTPAWAQVVETTRAMECVHFHGVSPDGSRVEHWVAPAKQQICWRSPDSIWFQDGASRQSLRFDTKTGTITRDTLGDTADFFAGFEGLFGAMQMSKDLTQEPPRPGARRIVISQKVSEVQVDGKRFADYEFVFDDPQGSVARNKSVYRVDLTTRRPIQLRKWLELSDEIPWTWDIDYPQEMPKDIFALFAPRGF